MYLAHVAPDNTMPVSGYEHRTLMCSECGDIERRLVFAGDQPPPDAETSVQVRPAREPPTKVMPPKGALAQKAALAQEPPAKEPSAQAGSVEKATPPDGGTPATVGETPLPARAVEPSGQDSRRENGREGSPAAPAENPPAKWAAAVERLRTRHTTLTQPPAAEKAAEGPSTAKAGDPSDFDRIWDNLPPRPQAPRPAPPRADPPDARPGVEALAARVRTAFARQPPRKPAGMLAQASQAPLAPARPKSAEHKGLAEPKTAASAPFGIETPRSRWARAIALLRTWPGKAARIEKNDAILHIDAAALEVRPRRPIDRS
jgi:hypothetical protein